VGVGGGLGAPQARNAVENAHRCEPEPAVRAELEAALAG
jgi:hypothetical protein